MNKKDDKKITIRVPRILILFLLLIVALAVLGVVYIDYIPATSANQLLVVMTALYVFLTGAYVYMTTLQWTAMREGLRLTRESNALTLRAWLVVTSVDKEQWFTHRRRNVNGRQEDWIDVVIANVGKIPATDIAIQTYPEMSPVSPEPPLPLPVGKRETENMVIGPGHSATFSVKARPLSAQDLASMRARTVDFVLGLRITYTDAINSTGETVINAAFQVNESNWTYIGPGNTVA